jgi:hypothetical protein
MHRKYNEYDYFSDDDGYDEIAATCAAVYSYKRSRRTPPVCRRLNWRLHVKKLHREGQFNRMYRLRYSSFRKLLTMLTPYLEVNEMQGSLRNRGMGHVSPELILHCLLRYLAGGSHHDIRVIAGIAKSTLFSCIHRGIDAVLKCPQLKLQFPTHTVGL